MGYAYYFDKNVRQYFTMVPDSVGVQIKIKVHYIKILKLWFLIKNIVFVYTKP